ncbi:MULTISPECIES: DUF6461 domain-containing protein [Streptomyces]|uniref:DUF6461 domain-containing protein n=1 Tax=Streptomyces TaxID=1883 RepID=UPI00359F2503
MGGICVNLTHGLSLEGVISNFCPNLKSARILDLGEVDDSLHRLEGQSIFRFGNIQGWVLSIEMYGTLSVQNETLSALSENGPSITVSYGANSYHVVSSWEFGSRVEHFEPGVRSSLNSSEIHPLWDATERLTAGAPDASAVLSSLEAVSKRVGFHVPFDVVAGPLLSAPSAQNFARPKEAEAAPGGSALGPQLPGLNAGRLEEREAPVQGGEEPDPGGPAA